MGQGIASAVSTQPTSVSQDELCALISYCLLSTLGVLSFGVEPGTNPRREELSQHCGEQEVLGGLGF